MLTGASSKALGDNIWYKKRAVNNYTALWGVLFVVGMRGVEPPTP
ncbi:protein of unknown function [Maridesulfovibrio hydrothermalis AM13 = DSM 14728]|uniref:Uncharacterized protein n=1 Tax=Maridesulfovibrio hydrothermalis AM13 = DSM 14728 TaxID=1121451 RepID=L0RC02_9BACT|nr:protein of unknown function [Maridesulfovibrio hydrothermalis AM13 = DSM 14728]